MDKSRPVNFKRLFVFPLIVATVFISILSLIVYQVTLNKYRSQLRNLALQTAQQQAEIIEQNKRYQKLLIDSINDMLLTSARTVLEHRQLLSNEYLATLTSLSDTEFIYFFDDTGTVIYDSSGLYVGWQASIGDPVYQFIMSTDTVYHEEIRKSLVEDNYYKLTYLRDEDNYFVQVGIRAETFMAQTEQFEYQTVINKIVAENDNLAYALIINQNYEAIADTDIEDIGTIYANDSSYMAAFNNEPNVEEWYYQRQNMTVLEAAYPIYENEEIFNVLAIGYSLKMFTQSQIYLLIGFISLSICIYAIFFIMQYVLLFRPLRVLNDAINQVDVESMQAKEFYDEKSVFSGIYQTLDQLSKRIIDENNKNYRLNKRISTMAYTDYLTGIPNRLAFIEKLNEALQKYEKIAIVFFDLDGFKEYNDTLGHTFGDALLKSFTKRFESFNGDDTCFARFGGDEFFMYHRYETMVDLRSWVENIAQMFDKSFEVDNALYPLDSGIGVSLYPEHDTSVEQLIRKADIAMYYSKKRGKNFVEFYDESMDSILKSDNEIIKKMKQAIKNDGFKVVYQPQVNIYTNEIISIEALLRIKDETISPAIFIPLAEQGGIINMIGRIVIRNVIEQLAQWKEKGVELVPVYVNLSSMQFEDEGLIKFIQDLLYDHQIEAQYLGFEMTESTIIKKEQIAYNFLQKLNEIGIHTAIDDFGSGHSGLSYLTKYHVEIVKLDRDFCVKYLNDDGLPIFNNIVNLTKLLGFQVLAEGIETDDQLNRLKQTDCHLVQGYYYYRPTDADVILSILKSKNRDS